MPNELLEFLRHLLDPAAFEKAQQMLRVMTDTSTDESLRPPGSPEPLRGAMDQRMAFDHASRSPGRIVADRETAIAAVEGTVGRHTVMACDSAESVLRTALAHMGFDTKGIHPSALAPIFHARRQQARQTTSGGTTARPAMDARAASDFDKRFPDAARIGAAY